MRECGRDFFPRVRWGCGSEGEPSLSIGIPSRAVYGSSATEEKVPNKVGATACAYIALSPKDVLHGTIQQAVQLNEQSS